MVQKVQSDVKIFIGNYLNLTLIHRRTYKSLKFISFTDNFKNKLSFDIFDCFVYKLMYMYVVHMNMSPSFSNVRIFMTKKENTSLVYGCHLYSKYICMR